MRLFQMSGMYEAYLKCFESRYPQASHCDFKKRSELLVADRFGATHILKPALDFQPNTFLTWENDTKLQLSWASEHGLKTKNPEKILLAQIEDHKTEVLYVLPCTRYDSAFIRKLPGCVKKSLCWRAAPIGKADLSGYDLCLTNFPEFIEKWSALGLSARWFSPSHDPVMDCYAGSQDRPVDVIFVGAYSLAHKKRARILQQVAALSGKYRVEFYLDRSAFRYVNIYGLLKIPVLYNRLPCNIASVAFSPVFGLDLYSLLGRSKIVVNIHIDMANNYRGNMRCFEALGCGACLVSDAGKYPPGLSPGQDFCTYSDADDCIEVIERLLAGSDERRELALTGNSSLRANFSKSGQWKLFQKLVAEVL